ncbi:O-antigen ligase family protein [Nocardioides sp. WS12]|uniref:O-antigen ligase family protein n=1 Tax=Nocardioides sp. WS12 TaxID=2486272 RepID=UPI0015F85581|nr:O-antigen ligase family protein [Nocardioides sp. WS12]
MPNQTVARPPKAPSGDGTTGVLETRLVTGLLVLVALGLVYIAARGPIAAVAAGMLAVLLLLLAVLGRERLAFFAMMGAFATAPMNKGIAPGGAESPITPTDLLFGLAVMLLVPTLLRRSLRLPLAYTIGISLILITGTLSTLFSPDPLFSAIQFVQWLVVILGLLGLFALWAPTWKMIDVLLWSYVAGQMISIAYAPIGGAVGNRYQGLSHHTNEFGGAGVMAFATLMYLWRRNDAVWYRALVALAMAASVGSVLASGSRAAAAVIAGLVLMIPFVERSALKGFVLAILGALFVFSLPFVIGNSGEGSALARLAGSADAIGADRARTEAQDFGINLFLQHPLVGNGFSEALYVHNVVLGVASSVGVIGLLGYFLVLFTLARPIIGNHPNRRLGYVVWAFIAITPTFPGLEDRTLWVPMAPAILLAIQVRMTSDKKKPAAKTALVTR